MNGIVPGDLQHSTTVRKAVHRYAALASSLLGMELDFLQRLPPMVTKFSPIFAASGRGRTHGGLWNLLIERGRLFILHALAAVLTI